MPLPYLQYTTLKFSSMEQLWYFQKQAGLRNYQYDIQDCTLRAQLTERQMELALILKALDQAQQKVA